MNLKKYNQEHLLKYKNQLTDFESKELMKNIDSIDFELIQRIYNSRSDSTYQPSKNIEPITAKELDKNEKERLFSKGLETIKNGEVAVVLMAGGQGTRLGHEGPKGTYDIGLPSGKSLFHLQADKLIVLHQLTDTYIPWYIMTSEDNHDETVKHFEEHNFFNYDKHKIYFFKQDRLPLVLENGQIAMKSKFEINLAANGNGGVLSSLSKHDYLTKMKNENIKHVVLYGVDNAIAKVADPTFVGFAVESKAQVSSKSVDKVAPEEKVGVLCYRDGHPDIVEYTEFPEELLDERDWDNRLLYRNGNIVSYIFSLDFLIESVSKDIEYHTAHKKVDYYDDELIKASMPNGYKFELFLFDVFKYATSMSVLSVKREEEFSPVKNKDGVDSPVSARQLILDEHHRWLKEAGYDLNHGIEVDTSKSYQGENLKNKPIETITYN